jgi:hypothetical protein
MKEKQSFGPNHIISILYVPKIIFDVPKGKKFGKGADILFFFLKDL